MHIGFDLTSLMPLPTGTDTAMRQLILALGRTDPDSRYTVFLNREDLAEFRETLPARFRLVARCRRNRAVRAIFQQTLIPWACRQSRIDVLHSPAFLTPLFRGGARQIVTIHDMTFFTMPEVHSELHRSTAFLRAVEWSAHHADLIHVPSGASKAEVATRWPEIDPNKIRVTPWGVGTEFQPAAAEAVERHRLRLSLPGRFILFLGTLEPRKNVGSLIHAYRELAAGSDAVPHLVLAGRLGWHYQEILSLMEATDLRGRVHHAGFVAQADLPWFYRAASLLVYPSSHEGFGLPPLEALACGVPVVSSATSAMEENLKGAAELTVPGDREALVQAMRRVLSESPERNRCRIEMGIAHARRFNWDRTAALVLDSYRELSGFA